MSQPESNLDQLWSSEQAIARQAYERMARYCPEWSSEENASDPGMALIQLFSWMSHETVSRLNLVPEKNHRHFLELLHVQLTPASPAHTELTFHLSVELPIDPSDKLDDTQALVPPRTQVTTLYAEEDDQGVIFTTDQELIIKRPPELKYLFRQDESRNYVREAGEMVGKSVDVFRQTSQLGSTFYLGFEVHAKQPLGGYILRLEFECEEREGAGINPEDPPLVWECLIETEQGEKWKELRPSVRRGEHDTTGGLNNALGSLVLYLPLAMKPSIIEGQYAYWIRCRHEQKHSSQGRFNVSPKVERIHCFSLGATVLATQLVFVKHDELGRSNGEANQTFFLTHHPILEPLSNGQETVEVQELQYQEFVFVPWTRVKDFSFSEVNDRHFTLDPVTGQVRFGPAIAQTDGSIKQYGRIPERGHQIRFSQYRRGGGSQGNIARGELQVLNTTVPYIRQVINLVPATGGRAQETLPEAKKRASEEIRIQERAVTASDYESLILAASREIRRVKCFTPRNDPSLPAGQIRLLIVPEATELVREKDWRGLRIRASLKEKINRYLARYQLPMMKVKISEPFYMGIRVTCQAVRAKRSTSSPELIKSRINEVLCRFLTPLPRTDDGYRGWPFGKPLYKGELMRLVEKVPGVRYIDELRLSCSRGRLDLSATPDKSDRANKEQNGANHSHADETSQLLTENLMTPVNDWVIEVPFDGLICSLDHQIEVVDL